MQITNCQATHAQIYCQFLRYCVYKCLSTSCPVNSVKGTSAIDFFLDIFSRQRAEYLFSRDQLQESDLTLLHFLIY